MYSRTREYENAPEEHAYRHGAVNLRERKERPGERNSGVSQLRRTHVAAPVTAAGPGDIDGPSAP